MSLMPLWIELELRSQGEKLFCEMATVVSMERTTLS
jgi:hypothetical protein